MDTVCWWVCPVWRRPCSSKPSPMYSNSASNAYSSRLTSCRGHHRYGDPGRTPQLQIPGKVRSSPTSSLADEINRTPPKTQAALLEAMQERNVTVGGETHKLPLPSSYWLPRTLLNRKEPIRCPKRSWTVSCSTSAWTIPALKKRSTW